jgi:hypothetical protein
VAFHKKREQTPWKCLSYLWSKIWLTLFTIFFCDAKYFSYHQDQFYICKAKGMVDIVDMILKIMQNFKDSEHIRTHDICLFKSRKCNRYSYCIEVNCDIFPLFRHVWYAICGKIKLLFMEFFLRVYVTSPVPKPMHQP